MLWLLLAASCDPRTYTSSAECVGVSEGVERDNCYTQTLPKLFCTDEAAGVKLVEEGVGDQVSRDFVWLQVTSKVDPYTSRWCDRIVDETLKKRCLAHRERPHLHKDVTENFCPNRPRPVPPQGVGARPQGSPPVMPPPSSMPPAALPGAGPGAGPNSAPNAGR